MVQYECHILSLSLSTFAAVSSSAVSVQTQLPYSSQFIFKAYQLSSKESRNSILCHCCNIFNLKYNIV